MRKENLDVVFYEAFEEETEMIRRYLPTSVQAGFFEKTIQEEDLSHAGSSLLSIRTQSIIPSEWNSGLKAILTRSTGYEHLLRYRTEPASGIDCGYLPSYCARAVAEHALLLWLCLMRKVLRQADQFHCFNRNGITGNEMMGKHVLVVGVGNIGSEVIRIAQGLGMKAWGVDLVKKHDFVEYRSLQEGLRDANIIVCAMNLTAENHGYFEYETLKRASPGTIFINIARGELAPEPDLLALLEEGILGGVGLDVYQDEKQLAVTLRSGLPGTDPGQQAVLRLASHPRAVLTPHNAFNTVESLERKAEQTVRQVMNYLERGAFLWNIP